MQKLSDAMAIADIHFPYNEYRSGQKEAIEKAFRTFLLSDKKYFILEAPVGAGKSVIAYTLAQAYESCYYLTSTKILQDQIITDFGGTEKTVDLKGRNAYECMYWDIIANLKTQPLGEIPPPKPSGYIGCDTGACKMRGESKCNLCFPTQARPLCPYYARLREAQKAHLTVMNFNSFLFQTKLARQFEARELMVVDECHNTEPQLMGFVSLSLNDALFEDIKFPKLNSAKEYAAWLRKSILEDKIKNNIRLATYSGNTKEADDWKNILFKYEQFLRADAKLWVSSYKDIRRGAARIIEFKPIFIREYAQDYIFSYAKKVLLMSATVLAPDEMCDSLGIKRDEVYAYRMKSRFPIENRKIMLTPVGSMSYKNKIETLPKLIEKVYEICEKYKGKRGIIHTHNFEIAQRIIADAPFDLTRRFKFQKNYRTKNEMLYDHGAREDSIIVAPAMHEGLDLKDDLARFAIICKVPYPSFQEDPQLKARMEISDTYYSWLTALKLVQSYGRTIRSETDYADTYILDSDIEWFLKKAKKMIPTWFSEAIQN